MSAPASITVNGHDLKIRPFTLNALERALPLMGDLDAGGSLSLKQIGAIREVLHLALKRDHPEATPEWIGENFEPADLRAAFEAIATVNGFAKVSVGEAAHP